MMDRNARIYEYLHNELAHNFTVEEINDIGKGIEEIVNTEDDYISKVKEFHEVFNHPISDKYNTLVDTPERSKLRLDLIKEELAELEQGFKHNNIVEIADALGDLLYVIYGTVLETGLHEKMLKVFTEIHLSNMSKICKNAEEVLETVEDYNKLQIEVNWKLVKKYYIVYRKDNNKILKGINYFTPNLKDILYPSKNIEK